MLKTAIGRLRVIGFLEALSYLYLLFASIYLKRMRGDEHAIMVPGWIHGILFTIFCFALLHAMIRAKWTVKTALKPFIASLLPFGPFVIEGWLRREDKRVQRDG